MPEIFLARQPIFNQKLEIAGYELLYRNAPGMESAHFKDADAATARVLLNAFAELGIGEVTGQYRGFVNLTRNMLLSSTPPPFPQDKVVIEVLEDVEYDEPVFQAIKHLKALGYTIALDDFVYEGHMNRFMALADIIKVDVLATPPDEHAELMDALKRHEVALLAEKIEDEAMFNCCKRHQFDYYQGYYLGKPALISGYRTATAQDTTFERLYDVLKPQHQTADLIAYIDMDDRLHYRINHLLLADTATHADLDSAALLAHLHVDDLRYGCVLVLLSQQENTPTDVLLHAYTRAQMGHQLGLHLNDAALARALFLCGLISASPLILGMPLPDIIESLPLPLDVYDALRDKTGRLGDVLSVLLHYEQTPLDTIMHSEITTSDCQKAHGAALKWAQETYKRLH